MTPKRLVTQIRAFCRAHADPTRAARYAGYFKEGYDPYGVPAESLLSHKQALLDAHAPTLGLEGFLDAGDTLVESGKYEEASFAILLVAGLRDEFTPAAFDRVGRWLDTGIRNWAHADVLCGEVLSVFLSRGVVPFSRMARWRTASSKWRRRAVAVALVTLAKKGHDPEPLLEFVRALMEDEAREVHQGVGWFLRELWKRNPNAVESYLDEWKDRAPRLIFQYATEKMDAATKARFKRPRRTICYT